MRRLLEKTGGRALGLTCDVTDEAQVKAAVDAALKDIRQVDILVNNAAFFNKKGVLDMSLDEWNEQSGVILGGAFLFTKHVCQAMIARGAAAAIINIVSTAGHQGEPGNIAYSTAKCGLLNFTRSAAMELVGHGIRVNSLTPTATDPDRILRARGALGPPAAKPREPRRLMEPFRDGVPMQKLPLPSDYARAAVFLGLGRCGDDHRHRPARRCRRGGALLGLGSDDEDALGHRLDRP